VVGAYLSGGGTPPPLDTFITNYFTLSLLRLIKVKGRSPKTGFLKVEWLTYTRKASTTTSPF
jgi:hypothetical protein